MRRIALGAGVMVLALAALYGALIQQSILKLVARQDAERTIKAEKSHLAELEATYMTARNAITEEVALSSGFVRAESPLFAVRTTPTISLSNTQ